MRHLTRSFTMKKNTFPTSSLKLQEGKLMKRERIITGAATEFIHSFKVLLLTILSLCRSASIDETASLESTSASSTRKVSESEPLQGSCIDSFFAY